MKKRVVIIGNSVAAVSAVRGLRSNGFDGRVDIFTDEAYYAYSRPMISELLAGHASVDEMFYEDESFYSENEVNLHLSSPVKKIDLDGKTVSVDSKKVPFDYCVLATGGVPFRPPIQNLDADGVFTFINIADAKKLQDYITEQSNVVVIGGGLIGTKAAEALYLRGIDVSIVELAPHILSTVIDQSGGDVYQGHLREKGFDLYTSVSAEEIIIKKGVVQGVRLSSGKKLNADAVVLATGVVPNKSLIADTGIEQGRGIIVNDCMQTSCPYVYAAGDVAEAMDTLLKIKRPLPIWPVAYRHGFAAGAHIAGKPVSLRTCFALNSISLAGLPLISGGITGGYDKKDVTVLSHLDKEAKVYKKFIIREGALQGFITINDIDRAGLFTGFVDTQEPVEGCIQDFLYEAPSIAKLPQTWFDKHLKQVPQFI